MYSPLIFIFVFFASVLFVSVSAQTQIPDCASGCLSSGDLGNCTAGDLNCLCRSQSFLSSFETCATLSCLLGGDLQTALNALTNQCNQLGVSTSLTSVSTTSSPTTSTASSSTTGSSSSSSPSPTNTPTTTDGTQTTTTVTTDTKAGPTPTESSPSQAGNSSSNTPIGAIVGGVVGGLCFIVLVLIMLFICRRESRKRRQARLENEILQPDLLAGDDAERGINSANMAYASSEGRRSSYPASQSGTLSSTAYTEHAPLNNFAAPVAARGRGHDDKLQDQVEALKQEVARLKAQQEAGSPERNGPTSLAEMKQLQTQAVRNVYGDSAPPSYIDATGNAS